MCSGSRYLCHRAVDGRAVKSAMSGGFPHSEIHGSKPIPGSPWLIAGYHVLHRLLLPRHPPNALFALDSIQKKQGFSWHSKNLMLPMPGKTGQGCSLDLERQLPCPAEPDATQSPLGSRLSNVSCFRYLHDVKKSASREALVERTGIEPVTS